MMITYHGRDDERSIVYIGVRRKLLYRTMKKLINPERHCVDQDENGHLDADQDSEKILCEGTSIHAT